MSIPSYMLEEPKEQIIDRLYKDNMTLSLTIEKQATTFSAANANLVAELKEAKEKIRQQESNLAAVKELAKKQEQDLEAIEANVAKVYCHITDGRMSKAYYTAETVIAHFDDLRTAEIEHAENSVDNRIKARNQEIEELKKNKKYWKEKAVELGKELQRKNCGPHCCPKIRNQENKLVNQSKTIDALDREIKEKESKITELMAQITVYQEKLGRAWDGIVNQLLWSKEARGRKDVQAFLLDARSEGVTPEDCE